MNGDLLLAPAFLLALPPSLATAQTCGDERQELTSGHVGNFGYAVALDGDSVAVGAPHEDALGVASGAAYVFVDDGTAWIQQARLLAGDGAAHHAFGTAVAISGDMLLVGAPGHGHGAAYVFTRQAGAWSQQAQLLGSASARDFGHALALDVDTLAVGAPALNGGVAGAVHVYSRQGASWILDAQLLDPTTGGLWPREFGKAVALEGELLAVGVPSAHLSGDFSGGVVVYRRVAGTWTQVQVLVPQGLGYKDYFGSSVDIDGERIAGGAPARFYTEDPAVYLYEESGGAWVEEAKLQPSDWQVGDQFGAALSLSGGALLAGGPRSSPYGTFSGSAYLFRRVGNGWIEQAKLHPADGGAALESYGHGVATDGERALVGRPDHWEGAEQRGTVHHYVLPLPVGTPGCTCAAGLCGNPDPEGGCANSTGSGARLIALGSTNPDTLSLLAVGGVPKSPAVFVQADASAAPQPFGDGLSCAGGTVLVLNPPRKLEADGTLLLGACAGDTPISVLGAVVPGSGTTRIYQLWYRDPAGPCGSTYNLTHDVAIVW